MRRKLLLGLLAGWFVVAGSLLPRSAGLETTARAQDAPNPADKLSLESLSAPPPGGYQPAQHRASAAHASIQHARARYRPRGYAQSYHRPTYRRTPYRPRRAVTPSHRYRTPSHR